MNSGPHDDQDRQDMARLAAGEDRALNDLMDRYTERLFQFLVRELQNQSEAADLAEETFVRIYQNRSRFDARHKFTTWLYAIATNLVKDRYRWRQRHPEISAEAQQDKAGTDWMGQLSDPAPGPGESLEKTERAEAVRRAIAGLPEDVRTPLLLAEYEGLSHAEIGEVLDCSAKAVELRLYRARQRLRVELTEILGEPKASRPAGV
jgi:RNA polymerase sigma-70 factor (ECF subfamily)